jgi:hypothetical protein
LSLVDAYSRNTRQYPDSIVNRISGIMMDDAVSPWSSTFSSEVDHFTSSGSSSSP